MTPASWAEIKAREIVKTWDDDNLGYLRKLIAQALEEAARIEWPPAESLAHAASDSKNAEMFIAGVRWLKSRIKKKEK